LADLQGHHPIKTAIIALQRLAFGPRRAGSAPPS
jgi:hypothetical protein